MLTRLLFPFLLLFSVPLVAAPFPAALPAASGVEDPDPLTATTEATTPSCFGEANGSVHIIATGGVAPYHGDVDASGEATFENLAAGSYTYEVYDAEDVLLTVIVELTQPDTLQVDTTTLTGQTAEALGTINVVPTGGTAPYVYAWSNGAVADTLSSLTAGTYTLTVTDALGCTAVDSFVVRDLIPPPTASYVLLNDVTCAGDSNATLQLVAEGGVPPYHGSINAAGDTTFQQLSGGEYTFLVYDARDSLATVIASVHEPDTLQVDLLRLSDETTEEKGEIKVAVSGGTRPYTYDWGHISLAGDLIVELDHGTYHLMLTDANGCTRLDSFEVQNLSPTSFLQAGEVSIYPTLVRGHVRVDLQDRARVRRITVLGATGQLISRQSYADEREVNLGAGQLPRQPGTYVLWIETADGRAHARRFVSAGQ